MYRGAVLERTVTFPAGTRITVPTGIAAFPDPVYPPPPRSHVKKTYNVVHWTDMTTGGHFAALEQPELLLADMRQFFAEATSPGQVRASGHRSLLRASAVTAALVAAVAYTLAWAARRK